MTEASGRRQHRGVPHVDYARSNGVNIAYQVVGEGSRDLLIVPGWVSHLALDWDEPRWLRWIERLQRFARVIRFDKRGTGLSDRPAHIPSVDERVADAKCVLDEIGVESADILGWSEGGPLGMLLAVMYPERVRTLTLHATQATFRLRPDYPFAPDEASFRYDELERGWGSEEFARFYLGDDADESSVRRLARYHQSAASPAAAVALARANQKIDVRGVLGAIRAPTLVIGRSLDPVAPPAAVEYLADCIPGARLVQLQGGGHAPWQGDIDPWCHEFESFLTGAPPPRVESTAVRAILQCDLVGSTARVAALGNEPWADVLALFGRRADTAVETYGGTMIDRIGDSLMATFPGPVAAVRAARLVQAQARDLGLEARAGIHVGEVVVAGPAIRGIAVHVAARVMAKADADEIYVSQTVHDILAGSGLTFDDRGPHELKGIDGTRRLYAVVES